MKVKKYLPIALPTIITLLLVSLLSCTYRHCATLADFMTKVSILKFNFDFNKNDFSLSSVVAIFVFIFCYDRATSKKNYRLGKEYGSARWGTAEDIKPYIDKKHFENNVILSQTELLTMGKPFLIKYARNKNIMVVGGSGSGKTRFFVKPNLMQMHSSYVVTDPKGTVLIECGEMLKRGRKIGVNKKTEKPIYEPYNIKVFNTIDFSKSMHYNPFAYITEENREQDILKFVNALIKNTTAKEAKNAGDFWEKTEQLLYSAYIAMIFAMSPPEEWNMETLIDMINLSEVREDDETFKNVIDLQFEFLEMWIDNNFPEDIELLDCFEELRKIKIKPEQAKIGRFACKQYRAYKLSAGKTAKSILISCSTRLSPFAIDKIIEITRYDEMELDKIGDELSALFVIVSDTDDTFNFLAAIMYTQLFNLLCTKADNVYDGKLPYHVRFILDEFANIGQIPNFEKLIATIRSREISASIILQSKSQLKTMYKDSAGTIEGCCDTAIFLGGKEKDTLKDMSEMLGKETIDSYNTSKTKSNTDSYGTNYQKLGRELMTVDELSLMSGEKCIVDIRGVPKFFSNKYDITKHENYDLLSDEHPEKAFDVKKFVKQKKENRAMIKKSKLVKTYEF